MALLASEITILPAAASTTYDEASVLAAFLRDRPKPASSSLPATSIRDEAGGCLTEHWASGPSKYRLFLPLATNCRIDHWWQDEAGFTIVTEYFKLAFYFVRYGHLGYWLAACGGLALVAAWIRMREFDAPGGKGHRVREIDAVSCIDVYADFVENRGVYIEADGRVPQESL